MNAMIWAAAGYRALPPAYLAATKLVDLGLGYGLVHVGATALAGDEELTWTGLWVPVGSTGLTPPAVHSTQTVLGVRFVRRLLVGTVTATVPAPSVIRASADDPAKKKLTDFFFKKWVPPLR